MTEDEYENVIGELELKYEELEQTCYVLFAFIVGVGTQQEWHNWLITVAATIASYVIGWKYGAEKPFTNGILE